MNKQDKPRICEVLGVEVGERFKFTDVVGDTYSGVYIDGNGDIYFPIGESRTRLSGKDVCYIINHPECIVRRKRFTEQEIEDAKAIKRLISWAVRIKNFGYSVGIMRKDGMNIAINYAFPSIAPGESYTLDEIIGEG